MKAILTLTIAFFACQGCITPYKVQSSSDNTDAIFRDIPANASIVTTQSPIAGVDLYEALINVCLSRGHRIEKEDEKRLYFTTSGKDVGMSTLQRMNITVRSISDSLSQATIHTEWKGGTDVSAMASGMMGAHVDLEWEEAYGKKGRPGVAFGESVSVAWKVPYAKVSYR